MSGVFGVVDTNGQCDVAFLAKSVGQTMAHYLIQPLQSSPVDDMALKMRLYCLFTRKIPWPGLEGAEEQELHPGVLRAVAAL